MSKKETAKTRRRIIKAAATEFRRNGIAASGLSDLMAAAGLTHGGFYRHFKSKEHLVAEVTAAAAEMLTERIAAAASARGTERRFKAVVARYLSTSHRDDPGNGCLLAALGSEIARGDTQTRNAAMAGFLKLTAILTESIDKRKSAKSREFALAAAATMIGALLMSRIVTDRNLSVSILRNAEKFITQI